MLHTSRGLLTVESAVALYEKYLPDLHAVRAAQKALHATGMKAQLDYNSRITDASRERVRGAVATLATQVARLNERGVCVLFIRLPIQPPVDATPLERYMAQSVKAAFPEDRFNWIEFPDAGTYHTVDGLHLTNPSARRVADIISNRIAKEDQSDMCKSGNCCRSSNVNS